MGSAFFFNQDRLHPEGSILTFHAFIL